MRTLLYMAQSHALLSSEELQDALSVEMGTDGPNEDRRPAVTIIVGVCLGFVLENPITLKMEFFHAIVGEYLNQSGFTNQPEFDLGGCCVHYLMSKELTRPCPTEEEADQRRQQFPFGAYASRFWGAMIRGQFERRHKDLLVRFLTSDNRISSLQLLPPNTRYDTQLIGLPKDWTSQTLNTIHFAVYTCAYLRLKETMRPLLDQGIDPDYTAPLGAHFSPLHVAVQKADLEMCELLIKAGMNPNVKDNTGKSPIHYAMVPSGRDILRIQGLLEDGGGRFDLIDNRGQNALQYGLESGNSPNVGHLIKILSEQDFNHQDLDGNTTLHLAVTKGYAYDIKRLLKKNADPLISNKKGQRAIDLAMEDFDDSSETIMTAIRHSLVEKHSLSPDDGVLISTYLKECRRKHAERYEHIGQVKHGQGLITAATQQDAYELSVHLLDGANVDFVDKQSGMTPLHHAIVSNQEKPVWHLLAAGAHLYKTTREGVTAFELARNCSNPKIAALLQPIAPEPLGSSQSTLKWQTTRYQVGRGMWSKRLSGNELSAAYHNAAKLRDAMESSSMWTGPGMEVWYDYLVYREPDDRMNFPHESFRYVLIQSPRRSQSMVRFLANHLSLGQSSLLENCSWLNSFK